jgi:type II secretion system protein N
MGRLGAAISITNGNGSLDGSGSISGSKGSFNFQAKKLDLGKLGVLPMAAGIQGSGILDGKGSISGDLSVPSTLDGTINLNLSKVVIEAQNIMGFSIPNISISEGVIDISLEKSKANIKTFRIGKTGNVTDDLQGTITGDATLGRNWDAGNLNVKTHFSISPNVMKSFTLLDAILGGGKQPDGSFSFMLTGPLRAPMPTPMGAGSF